MSFPYIDIKGNFRTLCNISNDAMRGAQWTILELDEKERRLVTHRCRCIENRSFLLKVPHRSVNKTLTMDISIDKIFSCNQVTFDYTEIDGKREYEVMKIFNPIGLRFEIKLPSETPEYNYNLQSKEYVYYKGTNPTEWCWKLSQFIKHQPREDFIRTDTTKPRKIIDVTDYEKR